MTRYEILRQLSSPLFPVLHSRVRRLTRQLASHGDSAEILDVGGRSSPYTVGVAARVTVVDLPRTTEVQRTLALGVDPQTRQRIQSRRSNVVDVIIEDFTRSTLDDETFDIVLAIETLEHVDDDTGFLDQVARVLRPGGHFLMTTPNGDYILNEGADFNPDHVRHYRRDDLADLLRQRFSDSAVWYDIQTGKNRFRGLRRLETRRPVRALSTLVSNLLSHVESRDLEEQPRRTAHLFATARKAAPDDDVRGATVDA